MVSAASLQFCDARILIVDADGVFRRLPNGKELEGIDAFSEFLRQPQCLDVLIVAAGHWKDVLPIQRIREFFSDDIASRIIDVTPTIESTDQFTGHVEIFAWLEEHPEIKGYVVLESSVQAPLPPVVECGVFVHEGDVFSEAEYERLHILLRSVGCPTHNLSIQ